MVFASQFAAIRWIWAGFRASARSTQRSTIHESPVPVDLVLILKLSQQSLEQPLPDSGSVPALQSTPTSITGWEIGRRGKRTPGDASAQDKENPIDNTPRFTRLSSGILHMTVLSRLRNQWLKAFPQLVGK